MRKSLPDYEFSGARSPEFKSVETAADGSIIVEGWAARYDAIDREGEAFEGTAFTDSIAEFMRGNRQICYHHDLSAQVGQVMEMKHVSGRGLWAKSRIFYQPEGARHRYIYDNVLRGVTSGYSIGGFFSRRMGADGRPRIHKCDIVELTITGSPASGHGVTDFAIVTGKAIGASAADMKALRDDVELAKLRVQAAQLRDQYLSHAGPQAGIKAVPRTAPAPEYVEPTPAPNDSDVAARQQRWEDHRRTILAGRYAVEDKARAAGDPIPVWLEELPATAPRYFEREDRVLTVSATTDPLGPGVVELPTNMDALGRMPMPDIEELLTPDEKLELSSSPERRDSLMARVKERFKPRTDVEPRFANREPTYVASREPSVEDVFRGIAERNAPLEGETPEQTHARIARYDELEAGYDD